MATKSTNTTRKPRTKAATPEAEPEKTAVEAAAPAGDQRDELTAMRQVYEAQMEAMRKQMEQMQAMLEDAKRPQIVQIAADVEKVQFLFMAEVCDENVYEVGPGGMYGRIVGKTGTFVVPKAELSRAMDTMFRLLMDRRQIIVVSGLTDEEREAYGVNYSDGELLDRKAFAKMTELGDKILDIYPALCTGHKEMVEKHFYEAWGNKDSHISRETVSALNKLAKKAGRADNAFAVILKQMNAEDAE